MEVKIISATKNPMEIMWTAARTCYSEKDPIILFEEANPQEFERLLEIKKRQTKQFKFIKTILDSGHLSIAEHVNFTFAIEGISRACSHQLVRHRHCTFSQQSQRYVEIKENFNELLDLRNKYKNKTVEEERYLMEVCQKYFVGIDANNYKTYLDILLQYLYSIQIEKNAPEDARAILPNCTKTNVVMTCNLRELMHMSNLRLCTRAQLEIRKLFEEIKKEVTKIDPDIGSLLVPTCELNGFCTEHKSCGRKPMLNDMVEYFENGRRLRGKTNENL